MRALVRQYVEDAYFQGMLDHGASPDALSDRDRERIDRLIADQEQYVAKFAADSRDAVGDATQQQQIRQRIGLWTESILKAGNEGEVAAARTRKERLQFHTAADELVCPVCGPLNDKIVDAGESFGEDADGNAIYSTPVHPHCRCQIARYVGD